MAHLNNVRDGRKAKVFLASFGTTELTSVALGKIYAITAKASGTSAFGNLVVENQMPLLLTLLSL